MIILSRPSWSTRRACPRAGRSASSATYEARRRPRAAGASGVDVFRAADGGGRLPSSSQPSREGEAPADGEHPRDVDRRRRGPGRHRSGDGAAVGPGALNGAPPCAAGPAAPRAARRQTAAGMSAGHRCGRDRRPAPDAEILADRDGADLVRGSSSTTSHAGRGNPAPRERVPSLGSQDVPGRTGMSSLTQRKPRCPVVLRTSCPWRAAGRYRRQ
jgi:hypothetical protein